MQHATGKILSSRGVELTADVGVEWEEYPQQRTWGGSLTLPPSCNVMSLLRNRLRLELDDGRAATVMVKAVGSEAEFVGSAARVSTARHGRRPPCKRT